MTTASAEDARHSIGWTLTPEIVDFIGKYTGMPLKQHQIEGLEWMSKRNGGIIADEMGLGKTYMVCCYIAISIFQEIEKNRLRGGGGDEFPPVLIVVPKILVSQWKLEFSRMKIGITEYNNSQKLGKITITTYGHMLRSKKIRTIEWGKVIFDEAHTLRNPSTRSFISASMLYGQKWLITGTPYVNHIRDVYVLICLIKRLHYKVASIGKDTKKLEKMSENIKQEFKNCSIARKLGDYVVLPKKHIRTVKINSKKERILHSGLLMQARACDDGDDLSYCYFGKSFDIQCQIHAMVLAQMGTIMPRLLENKYSTDMEMILFDKKNDKISAAELDLQIKNSFKNNSKIQKIISDVVANNSQKRIIFTKYDSEGEYYKEDLELKGITSIDIISGKTKKSKRAEILKNGPDVLILNIDCAACGLNLTMYTDVYFSCNTWNDMCQSQSEARVYRIGQTQEVRIHKYYIENSFDDYMNETRQRKINNSILQ